MTFGFWLKKPIGYRTVKANTERKAFDIAVKKYGINNFWGWKRVYNNSM